MTPEVQLALVAAIVPTIAAVGAIVVVIVGNRRVAQVSQKADVIVAKVEEVHAASNGHLTAVTASLATANEKIASLEKLVTALGKK